MWIVRSSPLFCSIHYWCVSFRTVDELKGVPNNDDKRGQVEIERYVEDTHHIVDCKVQSCLPLHVGSLDACALDQEAFILLFDQELHEA